MKILLFWGLIVSAGLVSSQPDEGVIDIRLDYQVQGYVEGGIEVLFKESKDTPTSSAVWLPVCRTSNHDNDMTWGEDEAKVVCRQLNKVGGWPYTYLGDISSGEKAIDDFRCIGDEDFLWACAYDGETFIDSEDTHCGPDNQAGVKCYDTAEVRLVDNPPTRPHQGVVEVKYNIRDTDWMEVCYEGNEQSDATWTLENAQVVCKQLGYPDAMKTYQGVYYRLGQIQSIDDVTCTGDETQFVSCSSDLPGGGKCAGDNKVEVICFLPGYEGCFEDDAGVLLPLFGKEDPQMTIIKCHDLCRSMGSDFAGIKRGTFCRCGAWKDVSTNINKVSNEECSAPCGGEEDLYCGGDRRISIYRVSHNACDDPGIPVNSERIGESFAFGSAITYECDATHELIGQSTIQCIMGDNPHSVRWNGAAPTCRALPTTKTVDRMQTPKAVKDGPVNHPVDIGFAVGIAAAGLLLIVLIIATVCFIFWRKKAEREDNITAGDAISNDMVYPSPVFDPSGEVIPNPYFNPRMTPTADYNPDYEDIGFEKDSGVGLNIAAGAAVALPDYDTCFPKKS